MSYKNMNNEPYSLPLELNTNIENHQFLFLIIVGFLLLSLFIISPEAIFSNFFAILVPIAGVVIIIGSINKKITNNEIIIFKDEGIYDGETFHPWIKFEDVKTISCKGVTRSLCFYMKKSKYNSLKNPDYTISLTFLKSSDYNNLDIGRIILTARKAINDAKNFNKS